MTKQEAILTTQVKPTTSVINLIMHTKRAYQDTLVM